MLPNRLRFTGRARDIWSQEGLKMLLWYLSIVGIPIGWVYTYRWFARNTQLPDGTLASFEGTPGEIGRVFYALIALEFVTRWDPAKHFAHTQQAQEVIGIVSFVILQVLQGAVYREQARWVIQRSSFAGHLKSEFVGKLLPYLAWHLTLTLLLGCAVVWVVDSEARLLGILVLAGLPWLCTASARWSAGQTRIAGARLRFRGSGVALLWRGAIGMAMCCLIIPVPWVVVWNAKWVARNLELEESAPSVEAR